MSDCWKWGGVHRVSDGRPLFKGKQYAYRVIYEAARGPIPAGAVAHHACGNAWCVNPWHIELTTQSNHMRAHGFGGDANVGQADKTHCPAGHLYSEANTYRWGNERHCMTCRRAAKLRYRSSQRKATQ